MLGKHHMFKINKTLAASRGSSPPGLSPSPIWPRAARATRPLWSRRASPPRTKLGRRDLPGAEAPKAAKPVSASCSREHWPYVSDECLSGNGVKRPARTIQIERHIADGAPAVQFLRFRDRKTTVKSTESGLGSFVMIRFVRTAAAAAAFAAFAAPGQRRPAIAARSFLSRFSSRRSSPTRRSPKQRSLP